MKKEKQFKTIWAGNFSIQVPVKSEIIRHDIYAEQKAFFDSSLGQRIQKSIGKAAIEKLKGSISQEVKIGKCSFIFYIERELTPDDLKKFLESQTKSEVPVSDFKVGDIKGKTSGYIWWLRKNGSTACLALEGLAKEKQRVKKIAGKIIFSLKYVSDNN